MNNNGGFIGKNLYMVVDYLNNQQSTNKGLLIINLIMGKHIL